jgi:hypothetical protein
MELRGTVASINSRVSDHAAHLGTLDRDIQHLVNADASLASQVDILDGRASSRSKRPQPDASSSRCGSPTRLQLSTTRESTTTSSLCLLRLATNLSGSRRNIWLAGPAGSGKTTAAHQVADKLGPTFDSHGAIRTPFQVTGHYDIHGTYRSSQFRRIFENGGVILLDEVDASDPNAMMELNQALSTAR